MVEYKSIHTYTVNLGLNLGEYILNWNFDPTNNGSNIPCRVKVTWGNTTLDTGFRGSSEYDVDLNNLGYDITLGDQISGSLILNKNEEIPATATITLYTPIGESLAKVTLECDNQSDSDSDSDIPTENPPGSNNIIIPLVDIGALPWSSVFPEGTNNTTLDPAPCYAFLSMIHQTADPTATPPLLNITGNGAVVYLHNLQKSVIVNYVVPRRPHTRQLQGEDKLDFYLNNDYKFSIIFPNYQLKSYQLTGNWQAPNQTVALCPASNHMMFGAGTFWVNIQVEANLYMWFNIDCKPGNHNITWDGFFNQSHSINVDNYNFYRSMKTIEVNESHRNWGLLRCLMTNTKENWGSGNDWE